MIFDRDKKNNFFYNDFIINVIIFISISLNLFSSNSIFDFTLLTCVIIFLSKGSRMNWNYPLYIFFCGIYSDLIIGYPIGYSSTLFLLFLMVNQLSNFYGIFFLDIFRFFILFISLIFVFIFEYLVVYFQFSTNIFTPLNLLSVLFALIFYFPLNYLLKNNLKLYVSKE